MRYVLVLIFSLLTVFTGAGILYAQSGTIEGLTREQLEQQLKILEKDIEANKGQLDSKKQERKSIERDIGILEAKVREAKLSLKQRDLVISGVVSDIQKTEKQIYSLSARTARARASLAQIVRQKRSRDDQTLVEVILRGESITDVITDSDNVATVQESLSEAYEEIEKNKQELGVKKSELEEKQDEHEQLRVLQEQEKRNAEAREREKNEILRVTKGQEKNYETYIKQQERTASQIKNALFSLRDSTTGPVSFGTMLKYADEASAATGVRPELILGILTTESNLGKNVGKGTWTVDMHPTRDRPIFIEICAELGLNPDSMPVSKKVWYGYGGAMGPGQFIPSTWKGIRNRVASVSGENPPNPWNPRTAVFATALYLKDAGATTHTRSAERLAAQRYLAGWKNATKPAYAFYGNEVMGHVERYEREIKTVRGQ